MTSSSSVTPSTTETLSRIAQPAPILRSLLTDRGITAHFALDGLVTTIDAVHGERQLDLHPEALRQAAMADRLVVTKTDLIGGGVPVGLAARLRQLKASAARHCWNGFVSVASFFSKSATVKPGPSRGSRRTVVERKPTALSGCRFVSRHAFAMA